MKYKKMLSDISKIKDKDRNEIYANMSKDTKDNFQKIIDIIKFRD